MWNGPMELKRMIEKELDAALAECEMCEFEDGACEGMKRFIRLCGRVAGITGLGFHRSMQMVLEVMDQRTSVPRGTDKEGRKTVCLN